MRVIQKNATEWLFMVCACEGAHVCLCEAMCVRACGRVCVHVCVYVYGGAGRQEGYTN